MKLVPLAIPDIRMITPHALAMNVVFLKRLNNQINVARHGIKTVFLQDNHSVSKAVGTVRGLHFQTPPRAQAKLVRCGRGRLFDVAVDIRKGSPSFGQCVGAELSFENGRMLLVPAGFAHGFVTLEPVTELVCKCSETYAPETEGAVRCDDPDIGVEWPLYGAEPGLSNKDKVAPLLRDLDTPFAFGAAQ